MLSVLSDLYKIPETKPTIFFNQVIDIPGTF